MTRHLARPLLAALLAASLSPAAMGQNCSWGPTMYSTPDSPAMHMHSVWVQSPCSGGIVGCKAKTVRIAWVWDPLAQEFVVWDANPYPGTFESFKNCGGTLSVGFTMTEDEFPPGTVCCMELQFWAWVNGSYTYVSSGYNTWVNP